MPSDWLEGLDITDPMVVAEIAEMAAELESMEMTGGLAALVPLITDVEDEQLDWDDDDDDENEEEETDA